MVGEHIEMSEAERRAHDSCPATECDMQGGDHNICTQHHAAITALARERDDYKRAFETAKQLQESAEKQMDFQRAMGRLEQAEKMCRLDDQASGAEEGRDAQRRERDRLRALKEDKHGE